MNGSGKFDLLGSEVGIRIVAELLPKNQNAVERGAQLVRHVGQEL